jgi:hypothetical protein
LWFREERGDGGKLIDIKAGSDGSRKRWSSTRWPWKRWWAVPASELFGDCSPGGGSRSWLGWRGSEAHEGGVGRLSETVKARAL